MDRTLPAETERPAWMDRVAEKRAQAAEWQSLRGLLRRFGVPPGEVDDVAQEAALALHRTSSLLDRRALVWGVAKNTANHHLRASALGRQRFEEALLVWSPQPSPAAEEMAIVHGPAAMLSRAIAKLRDTAPQLHEVLSLHLEGLTMSQIAVRLMVPYGTAETRFQRARAVLRATVRRWAAEDASRTA